MNKKIPILIALISLLACFPVVTQASEGGSSLYLQGTYNDWAVAVWGPMGVYVRNDTFFYKCEFGAQPLGGRLAAGVNQNVWGNATKIAFVSDWKILGGTYGAAISIPVVINAYVTGGGRIANRGIFKGGSVSGLGDMMFIPFQLNWAWGDHHLTLLPVGVRAPTGGYQTDRLLNTGRNYWAFDSSFSYTWLDSKRGHEVSFTAGIFNNTRNPATDYRTGSEFHLDWLVGQHFSKRFAVGATGYWYYQVTNDQGPLPAPLKAENFDAAGAGVGAAMLFTPNIFGKDVNFIAKWVHDVYGKRRFEGDLFMFTVALKVF
jgi:hypothetical protein